MSNVVELERSCAYLVGRAIKHRRAGRYDEAMTLLIRAKDQFGPDEEIEMEMARIYEEIGCEEDAGRAYLRIVRLGGNYKAQALFQLALSAYQRSDLKRAMSYYQLFASDRNQKTVSAQESALLYEKLLKDTRTRVAFSRAARAKILERRTAEYLQRGKTAAARRAVIHAIELHPTAERFTLCACCHLLRQEAAQALVQAKRARQMMRSHVQTLCVLADAYQANGNAERAKRTIYLAAIHARNCEELYLTAVECAKYGEDQLTLVLTGKLLRKEAVHTEAMALRACALMNTGRMREAGRLLGRLCRLLPENSIYEAYFRLAEHGEKLNERLDLPVDVTREEGIERASLLVSMLYEGPDRMKEEPALLRRVCRNAAWALRSPMAGSTATTVALILMAGLFTELSRDVLMDALSDPLVDDQLKMAILQVLSGKEGFKPYYVDYEGRFARLAAGGICGGEGHKHVNSKVLQSVCDSLGASFPDAPSVLLPVYLSYLKTYQEPDKRHEEACKAALECIYHHLTNRREADWRVIMSRYGVSRRLGRVYVKRLLKAAQFSKQDNGSQRETEEEP